MRMPQPRNPPSPGSSRRANNCAQYRSKSIRQYAIKAIVENYKACIEEVINIPILQERFKANIAQGYLAEVLEEIVRQSKVEFNYEETTDEDGDEVTEE